MEQRKRQRLDKRKQTATQRSTMPLALLCSLKRKLFVWTRTRVRVRAIYTDSEDMQAAE